MSSGIPSRRRKPGRAVLLVGGAARSCASTVPGGASVSLESGRLPEYCPDGWRTLSTLGRHGVSLAHAPSERLYYFMKRCEPCGSNVAVAVLYPRRVQVVPILGVTDSPVAQKGGSRTWRAYDRPDTPLRNSRKPRCKRGPTNEACLEQPL